MSKIEKLEKRLQSALSEKNFYEAHQISRTIYYRLLELENYKELLKFLYTTFLVLSHEYASALDLAELFANTLQKSNMEVNEDVLSQIIDIYSKLFPYSQLLKSDENSKELKSDSDYRKNLLNMLINWSKKVGKNLFSKLYGDPRLHLQLARLYSTENNFEAAQIHYFVSEEPEEFAKYLVKYHQSQNDTNENMHEKETLIAQAVLQSLLFKKIKNSVFLFQHYVDFHSDIGHKRPYKAPLLNFIWIVLRSVYSKNLQDFTLAIDAYKDIIHSLDSSLFGYLERVGQIYFKLPPQSASVGFLANIFKSLLGKNPEEVEQEKIEDDDEDWEDAGDTHEFLTAPLPMELLSKIQDNSSKKDVSSVTNQAQIDGSEMDLD